MKLCHEESISKCGPSRVDRCPRNLRAAGDNLSAQNRAGDTFLQAHPRMKLHFSPTRRGKYLARKRMPCIPKQTKLGPCNEGQAMFEKGGCFELWRIKM